MSKENFGYLTDRGWHFSDELSMRVVSHTKENLETIKDGITSGTSKGLRVKIHATHAGLVTRNNGLYLPDRMRAAVSTWTDNYAKPIQVHHDDESDPIGRVISARYVDTTDQTIERYRSSNLRDSANLSDRKFWDNFTSEKTSFISKVRIVKMLDSLLQDKNNQGLGYIELDVLITDPVAIQKVLDGRYVTGSVGATSNKAVCSICDKNWVDEGRCGHKPGAIYDGKKCVLIAGDLSYDEYSFVNTPADKYSGVVHIEQNIPIHDSTDGAVSYLPVFSDSKEESLMSDNTQNPVNEVNVLIDKLFTDGLASDEAQKLFDLQIALVDKTLLGEGEELISFDDAAKLVSTSFAGPNKTLVASNVALAVAAKSLLDSYTGEKDKTEVLAVLDRKLKAFGYEAPISDAVQQVEVVPEVEVPVKDKALDFTVEFRGSKGTEEEVLDATKKIVQSIIDNLSSEVLAKVVTELNVVKVADSIDKAELDGLRAEVAKNETTIGDLRDKLSTVRKELKATYDDFNHVQDQLISAKESVHAVKTEKLKTLHLLDGTFNDSVNNEIATFNDEALDTAISTMSTKVDMAKIVDKMNSGLARTPGESITPPEGTETSISDSRVTRKPTFATQQMVDEIYRKTLLSQGYAAAKSYYDNAVKIGIASLKD
jgi:hypothetical protein